MKHFLLLTALTFSLAVWAHATPLRLDLEVSRQVTVDGQAKPAVEEKVTAILAEDFLEIRQGPDKIVHDFTALRSYRVEKGEVLNRSLYADVGFRVAELHNRLGLQKAMKESQIPNELLGDTVLVEHLFAVDDEETEAGLTVSGGTSKIFSHQEKLLAEFSTTGQKLEPAQLRAFVRFLRYYCGGHPDILADLLTSGQLPRQLRFDFYNLNEVVSYRLTTLEVEPHNEPRPSFSAPVSPPPGALRAAGEAALLLTPEQVSQQAEALRAQGRQALEAGDILKAMWIFFEAMMMDGTSDSPEMEQVRERLDETAESVAFTQAMLKANTDPEGTDVELQKMQQQAKDKAHVVEIFRAGIKLDANQQVQARDLYTQALSVNPLIVGVWNDLGDLFYSHYETDVAWACWDIARYLAPAHPWMVQMRKLEPYLRSNYPGFF